MIKGFNRRHLSLLYVFESIEEDVDVVLTELVEEISSCHIFTVSTTTKCSSNRQEETVVYMCTGEEASVTVFVWNADHGQFKLKFGLCTLIVRLFLCSSI
jgi:hypothetical protein